MVVHSWGVGAAALIFRGDDGGMDAWGSILSKAARQHGAIAAWQAAEEGISIDTFHRRVRREGWRREWPGVWAPPGSPRDRRHLLSAAVLAAGPDCLVTGVDGLWLHGLRVRTPATARLVVPMAVHAARHLAPQVKLISSRTLRDRDARHRNGLAVATPARCFVDLVIPPTPPVGRVRDFLVTARQARLVDLAGLEAAISRARGVPGINVLRRAVADVLDVEADSPFSDRVHRRLRRTGLRPDSTPAVVATRDRDLHPDITFARDRVAIECDSMLAHSDQHDLMVNNRKDRAYLAARWTVFRIGPMEFDRHWEGFVADLWTALSA